MEVIRGIEAGLPKPVPPIATQIGENQSGFQIMLVQSVLAFIDADDSGKTASLARESARNAQGYAEQIFEESLARHEFQEIAPVISERKKEILGKVFSLINSTEPELLYEILQDFQERFSLLLHFFVILHRLQNFNDIENLLSGLIFEQTIPPAKVKSVLDSIRKQLEQASADEGSAIVSPFIAPSPDVLSGTENALGADILEPGEEDLDAPACDMSVIEEIYSRKIPGYTLESWKTGTGGMWRLVRRKNQILELYVESQRGVLDCYSMRRDSADRPTPTGEVFLSIPTAALHIDYTMLEGYPSIILSVAAEILQNVFQYLSHQSRGEGHPIPLLMKSDVDALIELKRKRVQQKKT